MIETKCPHCRLALAVREAAAGRQFQCPSCLHLFTVPVPPPKTGGQPVLEPLDPPDDGEARPEGPSRRGRSKRRRKGKRGKEPALGHSSRRADPALLWLGGIALVLLGIFIGLGGGYLLFARAEPVDDAFLADLSAGEGAEASEADSTDEAGSATDPNSPAGMILGKWIGGIIAKELTYEFFKDGTVTVETARSKHTGKYKIIDATTLWMSGPTGEATMDMKLTPDDLELTIHSKLKMEAKVGKEPAEETTKEFDITLTFKRPGAAGDSAASKPDAKPARPAGPASGPKGSLRKSQQPKASPRGAGQ